jgi:hypothetical protein
MEKELLLEMMKELKALRSEVKELREICDNQTKLIEREASKEQKIIHVKDIYNSELDSSITKILLRLGISSKTKGFHALREAIKIVYYDITKITLVTKQLYPEVAHKLNSKPTRIERSMRSAIENAWLFSRRDEIFVDNKISSRPSNSEFISLIADYIRMEGELSDE